MMKKEIKNVNSENKIQKRLARTKCRSFPQSAFFLTRRNSQNKPNQFYRSHPSSPGDNLSISSGRSSVPMVPEFDFSSDSDDDHEMLLVFPFPSSGPFSKKSTNEKVAEEEKERSEPKKVESLKLKTIEGKIVEISDEETSATSRELIPEIDLSSDSEDDLELDIIARKLFLPRTEAYTLPKITESKLDKEIKGKKYFNKIYRKAPNRWFRELIGVFYTTYLDLYTHCKNRLSLTKYIFLVYGLASYFSALSIHLLDLLSNTWRLTLRYILRTILKLDQIATNVLNDRHNIVNISEEMLKNQAAD